MEELLKEIIEGVETYNNMKNNMKYFKGKGSKAYVIRRIDLLRDELLKLKKGIVKD